MNGESRFCVRNLAPSRGKKGGLEFYLNPYEQHKYNSGPVTLKDLEDWINEKGKIVMTPAQRAERRRY